MQRPAAAALLAGVCLLAGSVWVACGSRGVAASLGGHGVLFGSSPGRPRIDVWRAGSGVARVSRSRDAMDWPQWSPDGKQIAVAGIRGGWDLTAPYDIYVMRTDGTDVTRLTHDAARPRSPVLRAIEPSWSPDGSRLVFTRQFSDRPNDALAVVSVRSGRERTLHVAGDHPVWGRQGIAYVGARGIMLLNPRTGRASVFASPHAHIAGLAWSSKGELAALEGEFGQRIVVYSSTGRPVREFGTPSRAAGTCGATWSPGGTRLLVRVAEYAALLHRLPHDQRPQPGAYTGLWTVDRSGSQWHRLPIDARTCNASWR
ncbi:MAG TPA: hypothetical protein VFU30_09860 [Gaiellaceae bacterium]|nr:hypothetical protein [Gaiellaceae bacterium]